MGLGLRAGDVAISLGTSGTAFAVSATPTRDVSGAVAGFASATGSFLPLVCTLNATKVTDAVAGWLDVGRDELAMLALEMADERVVQMANPALTDVRRALADELAALEAMEKPDLQGATLTLASLARVVDSLPLRSEGGAADAAEGRADEETGAVARAWAAVKEAFSGLVKVTPPDEDKRAMLTPDAAQLLRANLALQLLAARLALLRGEQAIFEQSLDDADAWIERYFDLEDAQVASAREEALQVLPSHEAGDSRANAQGVFWKRASAHSPGSRSASATRSTGPARFSRQREM